MFKSNLELDHTSIYERVQPATIFKDHIFKQNISLKNRYKNPLRKDNKAGCFFSQKYGQLKFNDYAIGKSYSAIQMLAEYKKLSVPETTLFLDKYYSLGFLSGSIKPIKFKTKIMEKRISKIKGSPREFNKFDLNYWGQFGITKEWLNKAHIYPLKEVYYNRKLWYKDEENNPAYGFYDPKTEKIYKVYKPLSKDPLLKWKSTKFSHFELDHLLDPFIKYVILTGSLKDALVLQTMGFNAVSLGSETVTINPKLISELKSMFNTIYIFYDSDGQLYPPKGMSGKGLEAGRKVCEKYNLINITLPKTKLAKDISEYVQEFGKTKLTNYINTIINE